MALSKKTANEENPKKEPESSSKTEDVSEDKKDDDENRDPAVETPSKPGEDEGDVAPGASTSKRRFFPRVKHLLTREWEYVSLTGCWLL